MGGTASVYEPDPLPTQRNRRTSRLACLEVFAIDGGATSSDVNDNAEVGYFARGSRELVPVDSCPILVPELEEALGELTAALPAEPPAQEQTWTVEALLEGQVLDHRNFRVSRTPDPGAPR